MRSSANVASEPTRSVRAMIGAGKRRVAAVAAEAVIESWKRPLIGRGRLGPLPASTAVPVGLPELPDLISQPAGIRCLVAVGHLAPGNGCAGFAAQLARSLKRYGFDVCLAYTLDETSPRPSTEVADEIRAAGVSVTEVADAGAAERLLTCSPVDVITCHGGSEWWLDLAATRGIPTVDTLHLPGWIMHPDPAAERLRSDKLAKIVAPAALVRQAYLDSIAGLDPDKLVDIPYGIDVDRMRMPEREQARRWLGLRDEFLFVSLSRYCVQKNCLGLVRTFAAVAAECPEAHLLLSGPVVDPGYALQVARVRRRGPAADRIHLRGHFAQPSTLLSAADCFVIDSFFESGPIASLESLCAGTPVVLTDTGMAREQVDGGRAGILVANPLGDPLRARWDAVAASVRVVHENDQDMVAAMRTMIDNRDVWATERPALQARSVLRYHPDRAMTAHAKLLLACIAQRAPQAAT